jgi:hypothetical protein
MVLVFPVESSTVVDGQPAPGPGYVGDLEKRASWLAGFADVEVVHGQRVSDGSRCPGGGFAGLSAGGWGVHGGGHVRRLPSVLSCPMSSAERAGVSACWVSLVKVLLRRLTLSLPVVRFTWSSSPLPQPTSGSA